MSKYFLLLALYLCSTALVFSQEASLTVKKIMQDPKSWIGTSPSDVFWSEDGNTIYFNWNPDQHPGDSLYKITWTSRQPIKVSPSERRSLPSKNWDYDLKRARKVYVRNGNVYLLEIKSMKEQQLTNTIDTDSNPKFVQSDAAVSFERGGNLHYINIKSGMMTQVTNFKSGQKDTGKKSTAQDQWLETDQLTLIAYLQQEKDKKKQKEAWENQQKHKTPKTIYTGKQRVTGIHPNNNLKVIAYTLTQQAEGAKRTLVPDYVTQSGYTDQRNSRPKVGSPQGNSSLWIYDIYGDSVWQLASDHLPGLEDYKREKIDEIAYSTAPDWNLSGTKLLFSIYSKDNKHKWLALLDPEKGEVTVQDHQYDSAWIGGPGIRSWGSNEAKGWIDNETFWFVSEASGYAHLYTKKIGGDKPKTLTSGQFEIYSPQLSRDKARWYFEANLTHSGIRDFCTMPVAGGTIQLLTNKSGRWDASLSPNESRIAYIQSSSNRPGELYIGESPVKKRNSGAPTQITNSLTEDFKKYDWREPEFITFTARDGTEVPSRLYKPENQAAGGPAVIFVHGAGYLQNAHQWWSSYFREYMFHNLLVDKGYTVLDIDYRGSAGYGRDWRTAIYSHMGGWDLSDHVDGAKFLSEQLRVHPERIGIYGGSYGGFITLMAMFTEAETFAAGAALRSVTDWAHYNHGYTANILNTPVEDSIAYRKSSPIYYAEGLEGALLICHGMVDTNVHFQDVVRLAQRLIELEKENWEMAVYPVEDHGFTEPSSWTDEYRRILKLFEDHIGSGWSK